MARAPHRPVPSRARPPARRWFVRLRGCAWRCRRRAVDRRRPRKSRAGANDDPRGDVRDRRRAGFLHVVPALDPELAATRTLSGPEPVGTTATEWSRTLGGGAPRSGVVAHAHALAHRLPNTVLLGAFVAAVAALNVLWRTIETRPPHWDMGHHLSKSVVYLHHFSLAHPLEFLSSYHFYPPLVYWVTDVFYAVGGSQAMWVAVLSNVVWLAVLVFSTFGTAARLWNARVGWLSVVF